MTLFDPKTGRYVTFDLQRYGQTVSPVRPRRPGAVASGADAPHAEAAPEGEARPGAPASGALPPASSASKARRT